MKNIITLAEMVTLINAITETVFVDVENEIDYKPEMVGVCTAYYKLLFYSPETIEGEDINTFYQKWLSNQYYEELNTIDIVQNKEIDNAVEKKIAYKLSRMANPLNVALTELANKINVVLDKNTNILSEMKPEDIKSFVTNIGNISDKFDMKEVVNAVIAKTPKKTKSNKVIKITKE